jgi:hypothetical protein
VKLGAYQAYFDDQGMAILASWATLPYVVKPEVINEVMPFSA